VCHNRRATADIAGAHDCMLFLSGPVDPAPVLCLLLPRVTTVQTMPSGSSQSSPMLLSIMTGMSPGLSLTGSATPGMTCHSEATGGTRCPTCSTSTTKGKGQRCCSHARGLASAHVAGTGVIYRCSALHSALTVALWYTEKVACTGVLCSLYWSQQLMLRVCASSNLDCSMFLCLV